MRKHFIYWVLAWRFASLMALRATDPLTRIMKGIASEKGMFSYMASLLIFEEHSCGASIIGTHWSLTAAHCLHNGETGKILEDRFLSVSVGNEAYKLGQVYQIQLKIIHEGFDYNKQVNDVGLLKTLDPISFTLTSYPIKIDPYPIDDYERPIDSIVAGWGLTEETYQTHPMVPTEILRYAQVNTIPLPYCKQIYQSTNSTFVPSEANICVFTMVGRGTCIGDSGSPLIANGKQIGILSVGGTCDNKKPEVYTRISMYYTWIKKAVGETGNICDNISIL